MMQDPPEDVETSGGPEPAVHSAQDVRQGEIILRTRARRAVFVAGLVGLVIVAIILRLWGAG